MKVLLTLGLFLVVSAANPASMEQNLQDQMAEAFKKDSSIILVRNDTDQPLELRKLHLGKFLLCLTSDFNKFSMLEVVTDMFRNEETALARCRNGRILINRGYI